MAVRVHEQQIDSIKKLINQKSYHSYFRKQIGPPKIDDDRILMLCISLQDAGMPNEKREAYITSALLVQLALDIHEKVADPHISMKERQLSVLAGDFFSGKYYSILAKHGNVGLIRSLATAIKIVNEHKIYVYQYEAETIASFIQSVKEVELAVLEQFCLYFHSTTYIGLFNEIFFVKKVMSELKRFQAGELPIFIEGIKKYIVPEATGKYIYGLSLAEKEQIKQVCSSYVLHSKRTIEEIVRHTAEIPSILHSRIDELMETLQDVLSSCMEEN